MHACMHMYVPAHMPARSHPLTHLHTTSNFSSHNSHITHTQAPNLVPDGYARPRGGGTGGGGGSGSRGGGSGGHETTPEEDLEIALALSLSET